ncbi:hypothetical protein [Desulfopila aestuarii]|uniref:Uncharacterized protein n=1 Tax=Desulfopila aestuarii DSM 18488 TaxID=1121416 RepID=A0A1M7YHU5_9BACT|nr:hypothetical protein [Desulfopila aestuarii]SHO52207.1 hypothetical protein SAMN02745220_04417 [Desulfopila aestuarii DSM 18488]
MLLKQQKMQVLAILSDNLNNPHPQPVPTAAIAGKLNMSVMELHNILKIMDGLGIIQTDPDLRHNLITKQGLQYLNLETRVH